MKHALVVPRYGLDIVGGAELGARLLAEHLVADRGWEVEIFTTCARDHMTWADEYPAGTETHRGVTVHRAASTSGRPPLFFSFSERVLSAPSAATPAEAEQFIELQGPGCPALVDAVASSASDLVAFYPYLYSTTVRAIPAVADRSVLIPAAHDEPALHLPIFRSVFDAARGFAFQTEEERELVQRVFPVADRPQVVFGLGVDPTPDGAGAGRLPGDVTGLGDRPYLLCLGRVDGFKGTTMLGGFFGAYKQRRPGPLALVMAGPVTAPPAPHPDLVVTGPVDEADKWALLRGAAALVNPSPHEAFSLVIMEAWNEAVPVVVNGRCEATRGHCRRSAGGLWFDSYASFEAVVDRVAGDAALRRTLGRNGRSYVEEHYRWPAVIDRYARFAERVAGR
ncbi:MAG: glycosyltransferase family 4 protein [Actinomycetota bacterium]|jgi:glycosyltransferase involved in cell wall biosynthesis|nr:glycosyltransferase family 4 protein [Actinomycetota bacterium]